MNKFFKESLKRLSVPTWTHFGGALWIGIWPLFSAAESAAILQSIMATSGEPGTVGIFQLLVFASTCRKIMNLEENWRHT